MHKQTYSLERRQAECKNLREKYPERVPLIIEKNPRDKILPNPPKTKYLVPGDLSVGQFIMVIRRSIKMDSRQSLFLFVNEKLPPASMLISEVYAEHKDPDDGLLYCTISCLETFG